MTECARSSNPRYLSTFLFFPFRVYWGLSSCKRLFIKRRETEASKSKKTERSLPYIPRNVPLQSAYLHTLFKEATEVIRRQSKFREASTENLAKLKIAETRLSELKSSVLVLGKEATDAMLSVEEEQQQITFQKLLTMVDAERSYHQNIVSILEKLHSEMLVEEQLSESSPQSSNSPRILHDTTSTGTEHPEAEGKSSTYFIAKVMHSFDAQADGELSLEVDDYVVVRQVAPNGWSEGECNGKSGWFPSAYVVKSDKVPASKMVETDTTP